MRPRISMRRYLPHLPALLLLVVACIQVYLVRTQHLSPWKGGGFGMFSTNDDENRWMDIWVEDSQGERRIDVSGDFRFTLYAAFPDEGRLRALAYRIARVQRANGAPVHRVRVSVWRRDFAPGTMKPFKVPLRHVVVDFPGEPPS
jgi:hypothetical protein